MARDLDTGIIKPTPVIVDEQTKAAGMRAATAAAPAAAAQIAKTPDELLLDRVTTQIDKTKTAIKTLDPNTPIPGETAAERLARIKNTRVTGGGTEPPSEAPAGTHWSFIGGQWKLYKDVVSSDAAGVDTIVSSIDNGDGTTTTTWKSGRKETNVTYNKGNGTKTGTGTGTNTDNNISDVTKDAFAALQDLFTTYGLGSLSGEIAGYMAGGYTATEALIKLKTNPTGAYAERFAGNFARTKKGLNVMSESAYIELENSYANTLKAYGLGNMLSTDFKQNWKQFATYIENDISAPEFKDRIKTVEDRVVNADPGIKETFKQFYPSLTDKDLVSYFLNPTETIDKLKEKVTAAEIGSAFLGQGLTTDVQTATGFAQYGVDRATALQGAADIKSVLPRSEKLSNIYGEAGINYNQKSGEAEFLKSNQDAADQRKRLKSMERASFQGDSGVNSQYGSLAKNTQGAF